MSAYSPITGYCVPCSANSTFLGSACKRCGDRPDGIPAWRADEGLPDADYDIYRARYAATPRPQVSWRPVMSSRHVRNFWAEGHVIQQLNPKDHPGRERMAFSQSEYDRKVAAAGLDPDSGGVKYATSSGFAPTDDDPSQL